MKLRIARPELLVDIGRLVDARVRPRRGRPAGDRGADAAHDLNDDPLAPGALPDRLARGRADRRPAGAPPRHDRRLARARRPRLRPAGGHARAGRRARDHRARGERTVAGGRVLPRRLRHRCRTGGDADGDPRAEARRNGLVVSQVHAGAPRTGRPSAWPRSCGATTAASARRRIALTNMGATPLRAPRPRAGARRGRSGSGGAHGRGCRPCVRRERERGVPLPPGAGDRQAGDRGGDG